MSSFACSPCIKNTFSISNLFRSGKCKPPISMSYKQPDTTSLPILQPFAGNRNLTMRQKRARDLHVQRQKSNKDIRLTLLGTK